MIVDTSALLAYFDINEPRHRDVAQHIDDTDEPCVVSPYVLAKLDYLVTTRFGRSAELKVLEELYEGDWELASISTDQFREITEIVGRYQEPIGIADASNLVLADQFKTSIIATLDRRHFSFLTTGSGKSITIVP